jgi:GT2 family glycosyltransferase
MAQRMPEQLPPAEEPSGPRVSAVLLGFNQAPELRRAIEALERSQQRERLEILVVDCGSGDESPQLDARYPAINLLRLPHHFGATKAMNIATRTAKGELVFFLSPFVEVLPETVAALAARLEEDSSAAAVCPLLVDPEGNPVAQVFRDALGSEWGPVELDPAADSITVNYPGREALLVRKAFIRGINYFDERFGEFGAELDLAMQVRRAAKKIRVLPAIRATRHPGSDPFEGDVLVEVDKTLGAAALVGKYQGFLAGLRFRLAAILKALVSFDLRRFSLLVQGQKLDGNQKG